MKRTFKYNITKADEGKTISSFLREQGYSKSCLISLKKSAHSVILNDEYAFLNKKLSTNDRLEIHYEENSSSPNIVPNNIPIEIVYEDEDIIIINKYANMPVHPSIIHYDDTIANALMYYYISQNESFIFRCINRLDLDTSGLILVAKHGVSGCILSKAMTERKIHREYLAIAEGIIPPSGKICAPIARQDNSILERCIDFDKGEYAVTHFQRLSYHNGYSLIKLKLETGRTHQIRVHMKYIGHPLPGDYLYNPIYDKIKRQPLHSYKLSFIHPIRKNKMEFCAKLPDDFKPFINYI